MQTEETHRKRSVLFNGPFPLVRPGFGAGWQVSSYERRGRAPCAPGQAGKGIAPPAGALLLLIERGLGPRSLLLLFKLFG